MRSNLPLPNWPRLAFGLVAAGLLAVLLAYPARATEFRGGETVVIAAGEVIDDDLFVSARRVEMNGTVRGDLFAMGEEVIVNGRVEGSLAAAGQTLALNGEVQGSVYSAGFALSLGRQAAVGRNQYFGGFSLTTEPGSTLGRDLFAGCYQAILRGEVAGDVSVDGAALELEGLIQGDLRVTVAEPDLDFERSAPFFTGFLPGGARLIPPGLRLGEAARVEGDLRYISPTAQTIPGGVVRGQVVHTMPAPEAADEPPGEGVLTRLSRHFRARLGDFIALLIVGGLFLYLWPGIAGRASAKAKEEPLPATSWGCLVMLAFVVGVPLTGLAILLFAALGGLLTFGRLFDTILSLGGASLALTVAAFLFVLSLVTKAVIAFVVGRFVLRGLAPRASFGRWDDFAALAVGAFLYETLRAIPFGVGWLIGALVTLAGLGALFLTARDALTPRAAPGAPPAEA